MGEDQYNNFRQLDAPSSKKFKFFSDIFNALAFMQYIFSVGRLVKTLLPTHRHTHSSLLHTAVNIKIYEELQVRRQEGRSESRAQSLLQ
jgi:hypothetical protein